MDAGDEDPSMSFAICCVGLIWLKRCLSTVGGGVKESNRRGSGNLDLFDMPLGVVATNSLEIFELFRYPAEGGVELTPRCLLLAVGLITCWYGSTRLTDV